MLCGTGERHRHNIEILITEVTSLYTTHPLRAGCWHTPTGLVLGGAHSTMGLGVDRRHSRGRAGVPTRRWPRAAVVGDRGVRTADTATCL